MSTGWNMPEGCCDADIERHFGSGSEWPNEYFLEKYDSVTRLWDQLGSYGDESFATLEKDFDVLMKFFRVRVRAWNMDRGERIEWDCGPDEEDEVAA